MASKKSFIKSKKSPNQEEMLSPSKEADSQGSGDSLNKALQESDKKYDEEEEDDILVHPKETQHLKPPGSKSAKASAKSPTKKDAKDSERTTSTNRSPSAAKKNKDEKQGETPEKTSNDKGKKNGQTKKGTKKDDDEEYYDDIEEADDSSKEKHEKGGKNAKKQEEEGDKDGEEEEDKPKKKKVVLNKSNKAGGSTSTSNKEKKESKEAGKEENKVDEGKKSAQLGTNKKFKPPTIVKPSADKDESANKAKKGSKKGGKKEDKDMDVEKSEGAKKDDKKVKVDLSGYKSSTKKDDQDKTKKTGEKGKKSSGKDTNKDDKKAKKEAKKKKEAKPKKKKEAEVSEDELSDLDDEESDESMVLESDEEDDYDELGSDYGGEVDADGLQEISTSKKGKDERGGDTRWKNRLRASTGSSSGKRKLEKLTNADETEADYPKKKVKRSKRLIMYSGVSSDDLELISTAVNKFGEFEIEQAPGPFMSHLIYGSGTKRTMKLLYALAKRAWILDMSYIVASIEAGAWIFEKDHELKDLPTKKFRDTCGPLFKDLRIYFNGGENNKFEKVSIDEVKKLAEVAGAKVYEKPEEADVIVEDVEGSRKGTMKAQKFEMPKSVVSYEWIFDSLMKYSKMSYKDFEIMLS